MAVDRLLPTSSTPGPIDGSAYIDAVAEETGALWDRAVVALTGIGGTANDVTATCDPALIGSAKAGMIFTFIAALTNTTAMTLVIGTTPARPLTNDAGAALAPGQIVAGRQYVVLAGAASYRILASSNIQKVTDYQKITVTGPWNKPAGTPDDALVTVEGWAAGAGGGASATRGGGGGGGAYGRKIFRAGDLPASVACTVGTSAPGSAGGSTSFGAYLVIPGGGAGAGSGSANIVNGGGGGGDPLGAGAVGTTVAGGAAGGTSSTPGSWKAAPVTSGTIPSDASDAQGEGGAGGGLGDGTTYTFTRAGNGGRAVWGGGGGGGKGAVNGTGGTSVHGGNGGNSGAAGAIPGGGGGANAPGGRGELRIWTIG